MSSNLRGKVTKTVVFRLDCDEYERIDEVAKRFHITRSSILRISVAKFLEDIAEGYLRLPKNTPPPPEKDSIPKASDFKQDF